MHLYSLQVENYRAIRKGQLTFDESIAIIGENDSGKSSLLDALNRVLNPTFIGKEQPFEIHHFYHENGYSSAMEHLKISLIFKEKKVGEWSQKIYTPIQKILNKNCSEKQKIVLEVNALLEDKGEVTSFWKLRNCNTNNTTEDLDIINWLRRVNPIIMLSAGMLTGHGIDKLNKLPEPIETSTFPEQMMSSVQKVQVNAHSLLSGKSKNIFSDIETGYKAALQLNNYLTNLPGFNGIKFSIDKQLSPAISTKGKKTPILSTGSNSEKFGTLLIMYALLRACGNTSLSEVDPIWVFEDPEAHLHKITLASVRNIVQGIKGQKIITTNSGGLLATVPIYNIRRLVRNEGVISEFFVKQNALSKDDIRRINYHVRTHRNSAFFSRVWLLVEGETEFWILPRLARLLGFDFRIEGITCVEYAQSGLRPLLKIAEQLNIEWIILSDGDRAGLKYINQARSFANNENIEEKICVFPAKDVEQYFWNNGFSEVYIKHAHTRIKKEKLNPSRTIKAAVRNYSKPHLALSIVEAATLKNSPGIPTELVDLIENCVIAARKINV